MSILKIHNFQFIAIISLALVVGCKSHIGGVGSDTNYPDEIQTKFDKPSVPGPDVKGLWTSECVPTNIGGTARRVTLEFSEKNFIYQNTTFRDLKCTSSENLEKFSGVYQFSAKLSMGQWEIDYSYLKNHINYIMRGQRLELADNKLLISEFSYTVPTVNRELPLSRLTSPIQPEPAVCVHYSGRYQMNMDYIEIKQENCRKITWIYLPTYDHPTSTSFEYILDGIERSVGKQMIRSYFKEGLWITEYKDSKNQVIQMAHSFKKTPCNLMNPDGSDYLTREKLAGSDDLSTSCMFWKKVGGK
jgi:hypothetical protein